MITESLTAPPSVTKTFLTEMQGLFTFKRLRKSQIETNKEFLLWHSALRTQLLWRGLQWRCRRDPQPRTADPVFPHLGSSSQLQLRFHPWPRGFHMPQVQPHKKIKIKINRYLPPLTEMLNVPPADGRNSDSCFSSLMR